MRKTIICFIFALFILTPFFQVLAYNPNYRFTDQEKDTESGLYNFDAREYNPNIGRFNQPDSLLNELNQLNNQGDFHNKDEQLKRLLMNPQRLNYYSHAVNNTIKYVDPTGESPALFFPVALTVLSGVFLSGINTAYSPTYNSTAPAVASRNFGDLVPGWNQIPKLGRWGLGLMFGGLESKLSNSIASRLSTKLDSELANSLAKRGEGGFINLYRAVDSGEFERIMEKGISLSKYVTTDISEALSYLTNKGAEGKLVKFSVPIEKFIKMVTTDGLVRGTYGEEFKLISDEVRTILSNYLLEK